MQPFSYTHVQANTEAIARLAETDNAKLIGGGTNLVDLMKFRIENPDEIIDINSLDLKQVETLPNGAIRIGALVKNSVLAYNETIIRQFPVLSQALLSGASPQLRNMATVGGNLLQRTRCPYFYDTVFPCNKRKPGSGCSAINGYNRSNAVLGTSDKCIATHPSDMCVALTALDAVIIVEGVKGERRIPMVDFHLLPGQTPEKENALEKGDLIVAVEIPTIPYATNSHYLKVRDRASYEFALASAAVALDLQNGVVRAARIALGGVGTKPWRAFEAEKTLMGAKANKQSYRAAADNVLRQAKGLKYNSFKIELAKRTLVRALETIGGTI